MHSSDRFSTECLDIILMKSIAATHRMLIMNWLGKCNWSLFNSAVSDVFNLPYIHSVCCHHLVSARGAQIIIHKETKEGASVHC